MDLSQRKMARMHSLATSPRRPPPARRSRSSRGCRWPCSSIVLLVHTQRLTGSFAAAGRGHRRLRRRARRRWAAAGPLVDRRGQTAVLVASATVAAALLGALALLPAGVTLAAPDRARDRLGLATPPVGACLRALLPDLVGRPRRAARAYAVEASAVELTWVFGPPLALAAAARCGRPAPRSWAAASSCSPRPRRSRRSPRRATWRPAPARSGRAAARCGSPAMRTLVLVMTAVGVLLGAVEVAVTAAADGARRARRPPRRCSACGAPARSLGGLLATRRRTAGASSRLAVAAGRADGRSPAR